MTCIAEVLLFSLLHVLPNKVDFAVGFVHVLLDLGEGGEELRETVHLGGGLLVRMGHGGGIGAVSQVGDAQGLVFVLVDERDDVAVLAQLVVGFLDLFAQVGSFVAILRDWGLCEGAVRGRHLDRRVVDVAGAAIDGRETHDTPFVCLETEVRAVQVLLNDLRRCQVVPDLLVGGVFLQHETVLDFVPFLLADLQEAVQPGKGLLLFGQFHVLHQVDACAPCLEGFRIENLDAVYLGLGLVKLSGFQGLAGQQESFAGFLFHVFTSCQQATEACDE